MHEATGSGSIASSTTRGASSRRCAMLELPARDQHEGNSRRAAPRPG